MKKNNKNIQKSPLPEQFNSTSINTYGNYGLYYEYAFVRNLEQKIIYAKSQNSSCFAELYRKDPSKYLYLKINLHRKTNSAHKLVFDDDFVNYYLRILQDYFNFSYEINSVKDTCTLTICLKTNNKSGITKVFTTTLRYMFEAKFIYSLFIALHLLKNNEDNINLLTLLTILDNIFCNNGGHSLATYSKIYKYNKQQMINMLTQAPFTYIHDYANQNITFKEREYPNIITLDDIQQFQTTLHSIYQQF